MMGLHSAIDDILFKGALALISNVFLQQAAVRLPTSNVVVFSGRR